MYLFDTSLGDVFNRDRIAAGLTYRRSKGAWILVNSSLRQLGQ
jgi:hypothetical protein